MLRGLIWGALVMGLLSSGVASADSQSMRGTAGSRLEELKRRAAHEEQRQAEWRRRYQKHMQAVADAQQRIDEAEGKATWNNRGLTLKRLENAQDELAQSEQKLAAFREEARIAEVPPGWLRD